MGAVYQARQTSLDRPVAIKILPREFGADPVFRESFAAEAKAMARLNHPNLIGVYDFGDIDGMLFLVMELVPGKSLFHSCYGKAIDPAQAAEIIVAVCRGIDHAHNADILHRDIKPANILLSQNATPKIGDFGLAAPMNQSADAEEVVYGTPGYTAPEVIHRQVVDRRADIFSIGVMLHELLSGALPDENRTAPSLISGCPIGYDAIVARSTHPDPQMRYATAGELADALEKITSHAGPRLHVPAAARPAAPVQTVAKKKSPALALTLVALTAIAGVAIFASQNKKQPVPEQENETVAEAPAPIPQEPSPPEIKTPVEAIPIATPDPAPRKKDPLKQLARLKDKLASGSRDQFPDGTVARNGSHFLILQHPLPWSKALKFAEAHGAHLAVLPNAEDRKWIIKQFDTTAPMWIGAGLAANNSWQWMDGSPWNDSDRPIKPTHAVATDGLLAISTSGTMISQTADAKHPIILQWHDDASNPCTMEAQLKRTTESIEKNGLAKAMYPIGTRTFKQSHFLLLDSQLPWKKAHKFATDHKAHLAVPSSPAEAQWMTSTFSNIERTTTIWLGGYQLSPTSPWQWITKETWQSFGWEPGQPSKDTAQNRMLMSLATTASQETKNWSSSEGSADQVTATLLEWSKPKQVSTAGEFNLDQWLASVDGKIAQRVKPDVEDYKKEHDQRISQYVRAMKRAAKKIQIPGVGRGGRGGRRGRGQERIINLVDEAMDKVEESGELADSLPNFAPREFKEIHSEAQADLKKLTEAHEAKLKAHLEFYTKGLLAKATDLAKDGFVQQSRTLQSKVENIATDTTKFVNILGL